MTDRSGAVPAHRPAVAAGAGALTLAYVVWYAADLTLLGADPIAYNRVHRALGGVAPRAVLAGMLVAVLFHAADGLGATAVDLWPVLARLRTWFAAAARFVTFAAGIPLAAAMLWPALRSWWLP